MQWVNSSIQSQAVSGHQPDDYAQRDQNRDKVDSRGAAGVHRKIRSKECLISRAHPDKEEQPLPQREPQNATRSHQNKAFRLAQSQHSLAAIQHPDRDQI